MQSRKGLQPDLTSNGKSFKIASDANPDHWVTVPKYDIISNSAYLQVDYTPIKLLKIIAGGQANNITGFKTDFVPRLGLIIIPAESFGFKLSYEQASFAASAFERSSLSPPCFNGNILLTPEKITTYEANSFTQIIGWMHQ